MKSVFAFACLAATCVAVEARAATVRLVEPAFVQTVSGSTVADFRYRLSNTNWDIAIAPNGNPISGFASVDAGDNSALSGNSYAFSLVHTAGVGYAFTWFGLNGSDRTVSFTTADGTKGGVAATDAFNTISIGPNARAVGRPGNTGAASLGGLIFSAPSLGSTILVPDFAATATQGGAQDGLVERFIVADHNLALVDWTLSGVATLAAVGFGNTDERVKLDIKTRTAIDTTPAPIPLPAALPMLLAGLGAMGVIARRRKA